MDLIYCTLHHLEIIKTWTVIYHHVGKFNNNIQSPENVEALELGA